MCANHSALGRLDDELGVGRVQEHDDRAARFVDDLLDQPQCVCRAVSQPDEGHVGLLPRGDDTDLGDVDLWRKHLVPEAGDDRRDVGEPVLPFVRDEDAKARDPGFIRVQLDVRGVNGTGVVPVGGEVRGACVRQAARWEVPEPGGQAVFEWMRS